MLEENGCLSLQHVLSQDTCDALLAHINADSDRAKAAVLAGQLDFDLKFGGVNCRGKGVFGLRQDQWLPCEGIVAAAAREAMTNMAPLLERTVTTDGTMHELSSLVADPGAPRQNMHVDTIVLPCPQFPEASMEPLYTFFIALQDVEDNMVSPPPLPSSGNMFNLKANGLSHRVLALIKFTKGPNQPLSASYEQMGVHFLLN
ncbi:hypothetical protein T484DRAFT_1608209 [Baffinella frigidus]|nr:hypothetical protein T484DRAFT_1608209 [Cryptophyta sp. CCMP2293]